MGVADPAPHSRGRVVVRAEALNRHAFVLEGRGRHWWRPLAPHARVEVQMDAPALSWRGTGYVDQNAGAEPLERGVLRLDLVARENARRRGDPL